MANNNFGVRDVLENRSTGVHDITYDGKTINATVNGTPIKISTDGFTLGDNNRFTGDTATIRKNIKAATGYGGVNDILARNGRSVYFNPSEQKLYVNGRGFHTDNMINIDGQLMADNSEIQSILDATEFKNPYENMRINALESIQNYGGFSYNPYSDKALKLAQENAMQAIREDYGSRGLLDSSDATYEGMYEAANLVPQYEQMAYQRYLNSLGNKYDYLNTVLGLEKTAYEQYQTDLENLMGMNEYYDEKEKEDIEFKENGNRYWSEFAEDNYRDRRDNEFKNNVYSDEKALAEKEFEITNAWNRLKATKYADEDIAKTLGILVGYYDI